jgi:DNA-binding CsgD family transcriptional regulator
MDGDDLTSREKEIIFLCTETLSRKMIAARLKISIRTVDTHLRNIHLKTKTFSMSGLVVYGLRHMKNKADASST